MALKGSPFEHACFISYKHPPPAAPEHNFYTEFVRALRERLEFYLPTNIRTFLDEDADPGAAYPIDLAQKLCKSVCFVAVLTPEYLDSNWCQAELDAMTGFETKRLGNGQMGLVIPVVLRGDVRQWESIFRRKSVDQSSSVSALTLSSTAGITSARGYSRVSPVSAMETSGH